MLETRDSGKNSLVFDHSSDIDFSSRLFAYKFAMEPAP
jgi:hypothetical protein